MTIELRIGDLVALDPTFWSERYRNAACFSDTFIILDTKIKNVELYIDCICLYSQNEMKEVWWPYLALKKL